MDDSLSVSFVSRRLSVSRIDIPTAVAKSPLIAIGVVAVGRYYVGE